ncbi:ankyrin repeat domain-containing protein [Beggiatoa leptomitoformis]|uniref:Ankyrin repeat domain-containing protein n=1 Tax=Beggiatoa leptomitoformis TaxID=288004 RepID=A0A2N9YBD9_9GAMM|nr:ankyrin repeat domain-containing protein [Beggiatoa leptomitoformis]ALG66864.1 ankyrin repeat domain-containing protein [Beggiatoa leptomitoformis]AUI67781.1 ankyrin repeat domain-containing protein [Beggiatoa leptomitoformis]
MVLQTTTLEWLAQNAYDANDWTTVDEHGNNALAKAIMRDESAVAYDLLALNAIDLNHKNNDGNNALWFACFRNNISMIDALVKAGVEINNQNATGVSCLMYASSASKTDVVKSLLAHGADYRLKNQDDSTALDFVGNVEILRLLKPLFAVNKG